MKNEPVAWMSLFTCKSELGNIQLSDLFLTKPPTHLYDEVIPLYTHPVKEHKEPSVKEIDDLWINVINNIPANDHRPREWHFAKAILRKAQEK